MDDKEFGELGSIFDSVFQSDFHPKTHIRQMAVNGREMTRSFQLASADTLPLPLELTGSGEYGFTIVGTEVGPRVRVKPDGNEHRGQDHDDSLIREGMDKVGFRVVVVLNAEDAQACKE